MKLFGSKKGHFASDEKKHADSADAVNKTDKGIRTIWKNMNGVLKGLVIAVLVLLVLAAVLLILWKNWVKPPEIQSETTVTTKETLSDSTETVSLGDEEEETFKKPSTVTVITETNPDTGETVEVEQEIPASHKEGFYNILLAGTDEDGGRTDTIMIARLNTVDHSVALLSIPRDTLVAANYSVPKINGAYGAGGKGANGMEALKTQLARLLGFEVDGYVLIDFDAFHELINLVGDTQNGVTGIWFDVPCRMYYSDPTQNLYIDLYAGYQLLNAEQCEGVCRYRSGYANADIGRISVQQDFVRALAKQCLKIGNVTKIRELVEIYMDYVTTDLTVGNMVYFGQQLLQCDFDEMETFTLQGSAVMLKGISYYAIYTNKTLQIVNDYFNPYDVDITVYNVTIPDASYYASSGSSASSSEETGSEDGEEAPSEEELPENPEDPEDPENSENPETPGEEIDPDVLPDDSVSEEDTQPTGDEPGWDSPTTDSNGNTENVTPMPPDDTGDASESGGE